MSKRITITVDDDISDVDALECVLYAVKQGCISQDSKGNKYYCWGILFPDSNDSLGPDKYVLWTNRTSKEPNSSFKITRPPQNKAMNVSECMGDKTN